MAHTYRLPHVLVIGVGEHADVVTSKVRRDILLRQRALLQLIPRRAAHYRIGELVHASTRFPADHRSKGAVALTNRR